MSWFIRLGALVAFGVMAVSGGSLQARAEETKPYPTGPDHDSGFLRFVNGTADTLVVTAAGEGKITIPAGQDDRVVGQFQAVPTETDLTASADAGGHALPVALRFKANEFATVVVAVADGQPVVTILRDTPEDFNAVKADLALYNADPTCPAAGLLTAPKQQAIFKDLAAGAISHRSVNPVAAQVVGACGGTVFGEPVDLGALEGGGRYSLIVVPGTGGGHRLIAVKDKRLKF